MALTASTSGIGVNGFARDQPENSRADSISSGDPMTVVV
jgi:hypothetical protein